MWDLLSNPLSISIISAVAGWAGRQLLGEKRWNKLTGKAKEIIANPQVPITDPKDALKEAWAQVYEKEISKQVDRMVTRLNGVHK